MCLSNDGRKFGIRLPTEYHKGLRFSVRLPISFWWNYPIYSYQHETDDLFVLVSLSWSLFVVIVRDESEIVGTYKGKPRSLFNGHDKRRWLWSMKKEEYRGQLITKTRMLFVHNISGNLMCRRLNCEVISSFLNRGRFCTWCLFHNTFETFGCNLQNDNLQHWPRNTMHRLLT